MSQVKTYEEYLSAAYDFHVSLFREMLKNDDIRRDLKKLIVEAIEEYKYDTSPDRQED